MIWLVFSLVYVVPEFGTAVSQMVAILAYMQSVNSVISFVEIQFWLMIVSPKIDYLKVSNWHVWVSNQFPLWSSTNCLSTILSRITYLNFAVSYLSFMNDNSHAQIGRKLKTVNRRFERIIKLAQQVYHGDNSHAHLKWQKFILFHQPHTRSLPRHTLYADTSSVWRLTSVDNFADWSPALVVSPGHNGMIQRFR